SFIVGAWIGVMSTWPGRLVGAVLGFGAGALISAVSFDLAQEGVRLGGGDAVALGLACGALSYFLANRVIAGMKGRRAMPAPDRMLGQRSPSARSWTGYRNNWCWPSV